MLSSAQPRKACPGSATEAGNQLRLNGEPKGRLCVATHNGSILESVEASKASTGNLSTLGTRSTTTSPRSIPVR